MAKDEKATEARATEVGEVLVRVNPALWRTDFVEIDGKTFGHEEPFVSVSEREYESKLSKHTTTVRGNDEEQHEYQLLVRV